MSSHYVVTVETTTPANSDVADEWVTHLEAWHGVVSEGPGGHLVATITLPGESLRQAVLTGLALVEPLGSALTVDAQPEEVRDARQGWASMPDVVSVTQAAGILGVSRQRVLQMIDEGKLPGTKVGRSYTVPRTAVDALAGG